MQGQEEYLQLARMLLHNNVEMSAIWTARGLEYYLRHERGAAMQISPQDAQTLSTMIGFGARYKSH